MPLLNNPQAVTAVPMAALGCRAAGDREGAIQPHADHHDRQYAGRLRSVFAGPCREPDAIDKAAALALHGDSTVPGEP
jgi:hypothetical protein